ncbi:hypothetical protein CGMCC3_g2631 [Colletotrichum fructicola]|nr:uncharacterized protein CGMCC3_g2631 [Colletotrichum fructicola]KAE9581330.1 hypothetical protein CGMCC3_g2631 [Colletotrichum fructicola]KAF5483207.1 hypothetical protein CGCF413_v014594 [Colletotrichum fructicola]
MLSVPLPRQKIGRLKDVNSRLLSASPCLRQRLTVKDFNRSPRHNQLNPNRATCIRKPVASANSSASHIIPGSFAAE